MNPRLFVLFASLPLAAIAGPKKAPPPYTVSDISIAPDRNAFAQGVHLKVSFDVTVNKPPAKMTVPEVKATCEVDGKRRTDSSGDLTQFNKVGEGETVRVEANPFMMQGLTQAPNRCEVTISAKQMFGGVTKLGTWCMDGTEVKEGACPK